MTFPCFMQNCHSESDGILFLFGCTVSMNLYSVISTTYMSITKPSRHFYVIMASAWICLAASIHYTLIYDLPHLFTKTTLSISSFLVNGSCGLCAIAAVYRYARILDLRNRVFYACNSIIFVAQLTTFITQVINISESTSFPVRYSRLIMVLGVIPLGHFVFGFLLLYRNLKYKDIDIQTGIKQVGIVSNIFIVAIVTLWVIFTATVLFFSNNNVYFSAVIQLLQSTAVLLEYFAMTTTRKIQKVALEVIKTKEKTNTHIVSINNSEEQLDQPT